MDVAHNFDIAVSIIKHFLFDNQLFDFWGLALQLKQLNVKIKRIDLIYVKKIGFVSNI